MPLPIGLTPQQQAEVCFVDGLNVNGTVGTQSLWSWKGDIPATDSGAGATYKWGGGTSGTASGRINYHFDAGSDWSALLA